jgi:multiple sugar transport system permease protein
VWLFNDSVGFMNPFLTWLGVMPRPVQWLSDANIVMWSLVITTVWKVTGFAMLILLVGLQGVPDELYEAGRVDGTSRSQALRYITIPMMRSTFALVLVFLVTQFYLSFDQFFIMTQGGPRNTTVTVVYWIFTNAFIGFRLGYGSALAIVLLILLVIINGVQFRAIRRDAYS